MNIAVLNSSLTFSSQSDIQITKSGESDKCFYLVVGIKASAHLNIRLFLHAKDDPG